MVGFNQSHVHKIIQLSSRNCRFQLFVVLNYIVFNGQSHIATGSLQVEETSAYCTVNHMASASNYQHRLLYSNNQHIPRDIVLQLVLIPKTGCWFPKTCDNRLLTSFDIFCKFFTKSLIEM